MSSHSRLTAAVLVAGALLVTSCGTDDDASAEPVTTVGESDSVEADGESGASPSSGYPVEVENCGRTLRFEQPPATVLGTQEEDFLPLLRLGVSEPLSGLYYRFGNELRDEDAAALASVPALVTGDFALPSREVVINAAPDLVVVLRAGPLSDDGGSATIADIEAGGGQVFEGNASCADAPSVADLLQDIIDLGEIFNRQDEAVAAVAEFEAQLATIADATVGRDPVDLVIYDAGDGPIFLTSDPLVFDAVRLAGGRIVIDDLPARPEVSPEVLAAAQFDALAVFEYPEEFGLGSVEERAEFIFAIASGSRAAQTETFFGVQPMQPYLTIFPVIDHLARELAAVDVSP